VWRDGKIISLARSAGPLEETILQLIEDDAHQMWVTTNKGLMAVSARRLGSLGVGRDGFRPRQSALDSYVRAYRMDCAAPSSMAATTSPGCRTEDGMLWFPSIRGIVRVNPLHIATNTLPPPVHIERVVVDGKAQPLDREIDVAPGSHQLQFDYTALSMLVPQALHFKYQARWFRQGLDRRGQSHEPPITRVSRRAHTRSVCSRATTTVCGIPSGTSISLKFRPHYYQSPWFIMLCAWRRCCLRPARFTVCASGDCGASRMLSASRWRRARAIWSRQIEELLGAKERAELAAVAKVAVSREYEP
jgi:hypothetical protein